MSKRAFKALKGTFTLVSGLPPPYFDKKTIYRVIGFFKSKNDGGRPETCVNVLFRP